MSGQTVNEEFERNFGGNAADVFTTTTLERKALCIFGLLISIYQFCPIGGKPPVRS